MLILKEKQRPQFVIGNDESKLQFSVESRSLVNQVNDQVRKHSMIWRMLTTTNGTSNIHGKELPEQVSIHRKHIRSNTVRQIHKIGVWTRWDLTIGNNWVNHLWKSWSLIGDERVINLQRTKVYVFSDSVLCLGDSGKLPIERCMGTWLGWLKISSKLQKLWQNRRRANGIRVEYFPGFNTLQLNEKSNLLLRLEETPENFIRRSFFVSMFNDISCRSKNNEKECLTNTKLVSSYAKRFGKGQWSFIDPRSEKKWCCVSEYKKYGTIWLKRCCWNSQKVIVQFSALIVLRSTQKQRTWKIVNTLCCRPETFWDFFFVQLFLQISLVFTEQSRRYVKSMKSFMKERGDPLWWDNQVFHPCQVWWTQKYLWIAMTRPTKIFYCTNMENELKSYYNKSN